MNNPTVNRFVLTTMLLLCSNLHRQKDFITYSPNAKGELEGKPFLAAGEELMACTDLIRMRPLAPLEDYTRGMYRKTSCDLREYVSRLATLDLITSNTQREDLSIIARKDSRRTLYREPPLFDYRGAFLVSKESTELSDKLFTLYRQKGPAFRVSRSALASSLSAAGTSEEIEIMKQNISKYPEVFI